MHNRAPEGREQVRLLKLSINRISHFLPLFVTPNFRPPPLWLYRQIVRRQRLSDRRIFGHLSAVAVYSIPFVHILKFNTILPTLNLPGNKNLLRGPQLNISNITVKNRNVVV